MSHAKPTVLVVDDAPINIDVLLETLSDDYTVRVAGDGVSALSAVKKAVPDLILLDVMMPDVDGLDASPRGWLLGTSPGQARRLSISPSRGSAWPSSSAR
jgi:AmiR/NasT family two-component response regulator